MKELTLSKRSLVPPGGGAGRRGTRTCGRTHVHTSSGVTRANEVNQAGVIQPPACPLAPQPLRLSECLPAVRTHSGAPLKESLLTELARLLSSKGEEPTEPGTGKGRFFFWLHFGLRQTRSGNTGAVLAVTSH